MNRFSGARASKHKWNILYISTVIYLAFLAIERIDLLQGRGDFNLSLELLGSILFLAVYVIYILSNKGKFLLSRQLVSYLKIVAAFMVTVILSVVLSSDPVLSAKRVVLLVFYVFSGVFSVNYLITQQSEKMRSVIVNCMIFLSIVYAAFSIYDVFMWFHPDALSMLSSRLAFFQSNISSIGSMIVRVRGASGDPNRAGIFMIVSIYIILKYCKRPALKVIICTINFTILALTLSRTAFLCAALYGILQMHVSNKVSKKYIFRTVLIVFLVIAIAIGLYQVPLVQEAVDNTLDRLQSRDASASDHLSFIEIGITETFSNLKILLVGNGYGASSNLIKGDQYANFHNAFISFMVECGLLCMVLFLLLLIHPLLKNKSQFPIIIVLILANIPYQIYVEPYFWFLLPFICVMPQLQDASSPEKIRNGEN